MPKHLTTNDTTSFISSSQIGAISGVASLGSDGKVPNAQLPAVATGSVTSVQGRVGNVSLTADDVAAVPLSQKGVANGVPQLDANGRILTSQLPTSVVQSSALAVPNGIATLDSGGKLATAQIPTAPVTSVNTKTGAVSLTSTDVGALAASLRGAASGVASLDSTTKVPLAQIPSLITLYQQVPSIAANKPGQQLTSVVSGSNSAVWVDPMTYVVSSGALPLNPPNGALCVRTDVKALYSYIGGAWTALPYEEPWRTLTFPTTTVRGYENNNPSWIPQIRRMGSLVQIRGRMELVSGANFTSGVEVATLPSDCVPTQGIDLSGTSTTGSSQPGIARFQISPSSNVVTFFCGSGPNPATPWLGLTATYSVD